MVEVEITEPIVEEAAAEVYAGNIEVSALPTAAFVEADPSSVVDNINPEAFFDVSYNPVLARMIAHVVEAEGPVLDSLLARRIARAHGWQRTCSRIHERVNALASKTHRMIDDDVGTCYWATRQSPEMPIAFRRSADESAGTVDEICMPELVALAREVVAAGKSGEDAIVAMGRELGLQRLRIVSRGRFEKAMQQAGVQ